MTTLIIGLLAPVLILGAIVYFVVRRGLQFKELCEHGVDAQAVVEQKRSLAGHGSSSRQKKIVYRYTDSQGQSHVHTSVVTTNVYDVHDEGGPFAIVYSSKRPEVSAPKYLVDQARSALKKN
jgi:hypothetical protein